MNAKDLPYAIKIATPCPARWGDMTGDDRARYCDLCKKNVYNLSAMTASEAATLLEAKKGGLCARIYQRADGTILTEDCSFGIARQWRRVKTLVAGGVAAVLFTTVYARALVTEKPDASSPGEVRDRLAATMDDAVWTVRGWFGVKRPRMTMGVVSIVTSTRNPPTPSNSSNPPVAGTALVDDK